MILVLFEVHISVIHPPEAKPFQLWANLVRTTTQNRGWSLATAMCAYELRLAPGACDRDTTASEDVSLRLTHSSGPVFDRLVGTGIACVLCTPGSPVMTIRESPSPTARSATQCGLSTYDTCSSVWVLRM